MLESYRKARATFQAWLKKYPFLDRYFWHIVAAILTGSITIAYILLLLNRYWQFDFFFVDNVYFHTALWELSRFQTPIVNHPTLGKINIFGDHFHPTIIFVALLMRIFPWNETVFVTMAVTFGVSAYIGALIGFKVLKNKIVTLILVLAYMLYLGAQNAMIYGFHEINLMPLFFLGAIYFLLNRKYKLYWLFFGLTLLTKESLAAVGLGMGLFMLFGLKKHRKIGLATCIISVIYYLVATKIIIPHFSGGQFLYGATNLPRTPREWWLAFTYPSDKIQTFVVSMASFGLLPLLNIATLALVAQDFFIRYVFAIPGNVQYTLTYHYGIALDPILFLSSVWTLKIIQDRFKKIWLVYLFAGITLVSTLYYQKFYTLKAPLLLVINKQFYLSTPKNQFLWNLLAHVPHDGSIMTMNHMGLALSQYDVYPLAQNLKDFRILNPEYIVYDLRDGQNANNFFPNTVDGFNTLLAQIAAQKNYRLIYKQGDQYIWKREIQLEFSRDDEKLFNRGNP